MTKQQIIEARRSLLTLEISRLGLSVVARLAGKPDRQIKDMATGRKAFGDGVSIEIGPKIRPDLPRDWLVYPNQSTRVEEIPAPQLPSNIAVIKPATERDEAIERLLDLAAQLDLARIGQLTERAAMLLAEQPAKQTPSSSQ